MHISFFAQRRTETLTVSKAGDALTINGKLFDFTNLPEGGHLPVDALDTNWILEDVTRTNGSINLTLFVPVVPDVNGLMMVPAPLVDPADGVLLDVANPDNAND